jgi:hypothetical protein
VALLLLAARRKRWGEGLPPPARPK